MYSIPIPAGSLFRCGYSSNVQVELAESLVHKTEFRTRFTYTPEDNYLYITPPTGAIYDYIKTIEGGGYYMRHMGDSGVGGSFWLVRLFIRKNQTILHPTHVISTIW
jgi:hypothetical protein